MLIEINKNTDVVLETCGLINNVCTMDKVEGTEINNVKTISGLNFEGFAGFNEKYAKPLLEIFLNGKTKNTNTIRVLNVTGNLHNDESLHQARFFILKNNKETLFLFRTLKSFSISLPDLRLGYENENGREVIYLDRKILKVLSSLADDAKKDLAIYFYCIVRFLYAVSTVNPILTCNVDNDLIIEINGLSDLYSEYGQLPDFLSLEYIQLKEDVEFSEVGYSNTDYVRPTSMAGLDIRMSSTYVYNIFKTSKTENLCIINKTTKDYYIIMLDSGIVYTNNELKEFNTFDTLEWLPNLIYFMYKEVPNLSEYKIKHLPLDRLLSSRESEIEISNDATHFESFLNHYTYISENTDMKLYDGYFKTTKIKNSCGVSSLEEEYKDDEYAQQLYKQVKPYYEDFDLKDLTGIVKGVVKGQVYSMLFEGESGTGKSTAARVIASRSGLPFVAINCSTNIEESDIIGTFIPNPKKSSPDDPEFIWQDGALTKAVRHGYVSIIEELGGARPGILMKFNSLLDEARQLDLPNGEVLKAHPNFRIIATTNIGYEGTNRLNKALVNRFEICKKFTDLDEKEAKAVIMSRTGYTDATKVTKVFDVYRAIKKYSDEQNLGLVVSIRQLLNIFTQGKYYKSAREAINNLMLNQAFLEEPDHLKHFTDTVLNAFDLSFKI